MSVTNILYWDGLSEKVKDKKDGYSFQIGKLSLSYILLLTKEKIFSMEKLIH